MSNNSDVFDTLYDALQKAQVEEAKKKLQQEKELKMEQERLKREQKMTNDDKIVPMDNVIGEQIIAPIPGKKERKKSVTQTVRSNVKDQKSLMYEKQEASRAPKLQIDQKLVLWSWITGIVIAFISSAIVSFNGITSVALFVGLSQDWMAGLFFFFIELMYLLYLVAYLVLGSRVDEEGVAEKTGGAFWGMVSFGGIAVIANAFHTLDFWEYAWTNPQMWAGVILSISAPIAIIAASKMASRVVFAKAIKM
jgi:hypothetical protein